MPYINKEMRAAIDSGLAAADAGELNYAITQLILTYLGDAPRYQDYNDVVGVLECLKLEIANRSLFPYEAKKAKENGDLLWPHRDLYYGKGEDHDKL